MVPAPRTCFSRSMRTTQVPFPQSGSTFVYVAARMYSPDVSMRGHTAVVPAEELKVGFGASQCRGAALCAFCGLSALVTN